MEQEMVEGYCKHCKRIVQWVKHTNFPYYVCGTQGCYGRSKDPKNEKQPELKKKLWMI